MQAWASAAALEYGLARREGSERPDAIPRNIYEAASRRFLADPAFVLSYVSFLEGLADLTNARALFERALSAGPALQAAAKLWDAYVRFEFEHGDRAGVAAVEARRWEALGDAAPPDDLALLLLKYRYAAVLVVWT